MNILEFRKYINDKADRDLKNNKILSIASDMCFEAYKNSDLKALRRTVFDLAYNIMFYQNKHKLKNKTSLVLDFDPLSSEILIEKIKTWTVKVRKDLFTTEKAPFPFDLQAAVAWIEEQEKEQLPEEIEIKKNRFNQKIDEIFDLLDKGEILGSISINKHHLPYPGPNGWVKRVATKHNNALETLERETRHISSATGFPQYALTAYILTDIKPFIPRYKIIKNITSHKSPFEEDIQRTNINIEVNASDLTINEFKTIYKQYKENINLGKHKKSLNKKQKELYLFILRKGTPPKGKGATNYWKKARDEWNSNHPNNKEQYTSWEGIYKAYMGILKKI